MLRHRVSCALLFFTVFFASGVARAQQPDSLVRPAEGTASLEITSEPAGATVTLDDQLVGTTPLRKDDIRPGSARIAVLLSGYDRWSENMVFTAGQTEKITLQLIQTTAQLSVNTNRETSRIFIDGEERPAGIPFNVALGTHHVRIADETLHREIERDIVFTDRNIVVVDGKIAAPSISRMVGGVLFPGIMQIADGASIEGAALLAGFVGSTLFAVQAQGDLNDSKENYGGIHAQYDAARTELQAAILRTSLGGAYDRLASATRKRNIALAVLGAVFVGNAVEFLLNHRLADSITLNTYWGIDAQSSVLGDGRGVKLLSLSVALPIGGN